MEKTTKTNPPARTYGGLLTKALREILFARGKLNSLHNDITSYILRSKGKGKVSSSIYKSITDDEITWKAFLWLLFNVQKVKKLKLTFVVTHEDDTTSTHVIVATPKDDTNMAPKKTKKVIKDENAKQDTSVNKKIDNK